MPNSVYGKKIYTKYRLRGASDDEAKFLCNNEDLFKNKNLDNDINFYSEKIITFTKKVNDAQSKIDQIKSQFNYSLDNDDIKEYRNFVVKDITDKIKSGIDYSLDDYKVNGIDLLTNEDKDAINKTPKYQDTFNEYKNKKITYYDSDHNSVSEQIDITSYIEKIIKAKQKAGARNFDYNNAAIVTSLSTLNTVRYSVFTDCNDSKFNAISRQLTAFGNFFANAERNKDKLDNSENQNTINSKKKIVVENFNNQLKNNKEFADENANLSRTKSDLTFYNQSLDKIREFKKIREKYDAVKGKDLITSSENYINEVLDERNEFNSLSHGDRDLYKDRAENITAKLESLSNDFYVDFTKKMLTKEEKQRANDNKKDIYELKQYKDKYNKASKWDKFWQKALPNFLTDLGRTKNKMDELSKKLKKNNVSQDMIDFQNNFHENGDMEKPIFDESGVNKEYGINASNKTQVFQKNSIDNVNSDVKFVDNNNVNTNTMVDAKERSNKI